MIHKIVRLFVKALTADDKNYLLNRDNLTQPIQMLLSQKEKTFREFSSAFLRYILNFTHFPKKKMNIIAHVFPKLKAPKNVVRQMSKRS